MTTEQTAIGRGEKQILPTSKRQIEQYIDDFEYIKKLEREVESLSTQLQQEKQGNQYIEHLEKRQVAELYKRLQVMDNILRNEAMLTLGESLMSLDRSHLWEHLFEVLLELTDRNRTAFHGDSLPPETEAKAVHFLYLLSAFVQRERRFPRRDEQQVLFDGLVEMASKEMILEELSLSPQGRHQKARQEKQAQASSIGGGHGEWEEGDDEKALMKIARSKSIHFQRVIAIRAFVDRYPLSEDWNIVLTLIAKKHNSAALELLLDMPLGKELQRIVLQRSQKTHRAKKLPQTASLGIEPSEKPSSPQKRKRKRKKNKSSKTKSGGVLPD
jgi:hypothetical protein